MILGNKCDLEESRVVTEQKGRILAAEYGAEFFETSAKSGQNVEEAILTLARAIKDKMDKKDVSRKVDEGVLRRLGGGSHPMCLVDNQPHYTEVVVHLNVISSTSSSLLDHYYSFRASNPSGRLAPSTVNHSRQ